MYQYQSAVVRSIGLPINSEAKPAYWRRWEYRDRDQPFDGRGHCYMLEGLSHPVNETISKPDPLVITTISDLVASNPNPIVAEIGIGIGATTLEVAKILDNRGEIHIFDFDGRCAALIRDLSDLGFNNCYPHENSKRHWDSYNWSLMKLLRQRGSGIFDFIYLDGSHTFERDACAFLLCDRLLKIGGFIQFDDYFWTLAKSKWLPERDQFLTQEQIEEPNVRLICETLVDTDSRYENVVKYKTWCKRAHY